MNRCWFVSATLGRDEACALSSCKADDVFIKRWCVADSGPGGDDVDPESLLPPDKRQKLNSLYDSGGGRSGAMGSGRSSNTERNRNNNESYYDLAEDEFDLSALGSIPRREKAVGLVGGVADDSFRDEDGGEIDEAKTWLKQCTQQAEDEEVYSELEDDEEDVAVLKYERAEIRNGLENDAVEGVEGAFENTVAQIGKSKDDLDGLLEESETISVRFMDKSKNELRVLATVNDTFEYPFGKFKDHAINKVLATVENHVCCAGIVVVHLKYHDIIVS